MGWQKSSRSASNGCVEFSKGSRCRNASCAEFGELDDTRQAPMHKPDATVTLRDSKDKDGPWLFFNNEEWNAFLAGVRDGEFDQAN